MRFLLRGILAFLVATGHAAQDYSTSNSQPRTETCRDALFPLAGVTPTGRFDSRESLYVCLTNPGTPDVAYQIYVNGNKKFGVTPDEAKSFNVYISNTYSVNCSDPREKDAEKNASSMPKLDLPIAFDASHPFCVVSTKINNRTVRAAFVFDTFDRLHDSAIFELTPEERKTHDELKAVANESGCARDFNRDGSPTPCLTQYREEKAACPSYGKSCFDPALAGAWLLQRHEIAHEPKLQQLIPHLHGWIIYPDRSVRPLAVDFETGALVEGQKNLSFSRVNYGCNGELYQETIGFAQGSTGVFCGRYTFDEKSLGISKDKTAGFQYYEPVAMGTKYMEPIHFDFAARIGEQSVSVPHVGTKLPAYAIAEGSGDRHRAIIQVFGDSDEFYFFIPHLSQTGRYTGTNAGKVTINQSSYRGFYTKDDPTAPNEIAIDVFDTTKGRITGKFSYTVANKDKSLRVEGRFDIPLYVLHIQKEN